MDGTGDHRVKQSEPGSERQRSHIFSPMWKIDSKGKCIHKYNKSVVVDYLRGLGRGRR
jgi:hypothetical protein